jgi:hypothetical protein
MTISRSPSDWLSFLLAAYVASTTFGCEPNNTASQKKTDWPDDWPGPEPRIEPRPTAGHRAKMMRLGVLVDEKGKLPDELQYKRLCHKDDEQGEQPFCEGTPLTDALVLTSSSPTCSGILISKNEVLTAAHCYTDQGDSKTRVAVGYYEGDMLDTPEDCSETRSQPATWVAVASCNSGQRNCGDAAPSNNTDIAILTLQTTVTAAMLGGDEIANSAIELLEKKTLKDGFELSDSDLRRASLDLDSIQMPLGMRGRYLDTSRTELYPALFGVLAGSSGAPIFNETTLSVHAVIAGASNSTPSAEYDENKKCAEWRPQANNDAAAIARTTYLQ